MRRILVTGGAGFVGANLSIALARSGAGEEIIAFDSLRRRGSELNVTRLREAGVRFVHGDVRDLPDLTSVGPIAALVECSAEPSVLAGVDGDPDFAVRTNLFGAWHCLELARRHEAQVIFLSTSRVYPVEPLRRLAYEETETRFELRTEQPYPGASGAGISESFPLAGARTLYGATKLAAELLATEYAEGYGLQANVNRCGVIAGPWQMGRVDQGVFMFWVLHHYLGLPLRYIGFGGRGKQVRDLMHIDDLVDLVQRQLASPADWAGVTTNVGGGREVSLSLAETTELCRELTGRTVPVEPDHDSRPGDIPVYISDCSELMSRSEWRPRRGPREVLEDTLRWLTDNRDLVTSALGY